MVKKFNDKKKLENLYFIKLPTTKNKLINLLRGLEYKSFKPYFKIENKNILLVVIKL